MVKKYRIIVITITFLFWGIRVGFSNEPKKNTSSLFGSVDLTMAGRNLSSTEAEQLEKTLGQNPTDLPTRVKLVTYYFSHQFQSDSARKDHQRHALWIIEHYPADEAAGIVEAHLEPILDGDGYRQAKALWVKHLAKSKKDPRLLWNAGEFFLIYDKKMAESLLTEGQRLEPGNSKWPEKLGQLYSLEVAGKTGESKQKIAAKALAEYEKALAMTKKESSRGYLLPGVAKMAIEANELEKAGKYATELLNVKSRDWNYGNAVHCGNLILGRLALKAGNVNLAKQHLIAAGKTPGSPQLNSFGPNMILAKELLEKGERKAVIQYLELCGKFWVMGKERLKDWIALIEKERIPDFRGNLLY